MITKFEITMMGELKFFLYSQLKQLCDDTFISQENYTHSKIEHGRAMSRPPRLPCLPMGNLYFVRRNNMWIKKGFQILKEHVLLL
jgi:hypothetical protein